MRSHSCYTVWAYQADPLLLQTVPLLKGGHHVCSVSAKPHDLLVVWHLDGTHSIWQGSKGAMACLQRTQAAHAWRDIGQVRVRGDQLF